MDIMARLIWSFLQENLINGFKIAAIINAIKKGVSIDPKTLIIIIVVPMITPK